MPLIVARRADRCAAVGCGGAIRKGEYASYSREGGLVHPECAGQPNARPDACAGCGTPVAAGAGRLHHQEEPAVGGSFRHRYSVTCATCPPPAR